MRNSVVTACCIVCALIGSKACGQWREVANEAVTLYAGSGRPTMYAVNCLGKYSTDPFGTGSMRGNGYQMIKLASGRWIEGANEYSDPHNQKLGGYAHCCVVHFGEPGTKDIVYLLTDSRLYRLGDDGDSLNEEFRLPSKELVFTGRVLRDRGSLAAYLLPVTTDKRLSADGHYVFKGVVTFSQGKSRYLPYSGKYHGQVIGAHSLNVVWISRGTLSETSHRLDGNIIYLESDNYEYTTFRVLLINDTLRDLPPEKVSVQNNKVVLTTPQIILTPRSD